MRKLGKFLFIGLFEPESPNFGTMWLGTKNSGSSFLFSLPGKFSCILKVDIAPITFADLFNAWAREL